MRTRAVLVLALLLSGCSGGPSGAASCAGPTVSVHPAQARVGQEVTIRATGLHEGCNDHDGADEERPLTDVPVELVQNGVQVTLSTVTAGPPDYAVEVVVPVPGSVAAGPAVVVLGLGSTPSTPFTVLP